VKSGAEPRTPAAAEAHESLEDLEIRLLLEGVYHRYGYDFRDYAMTSLRRRVRHCLESEGLSTVSALQDRVLHDRAALLRLVEAISVSVTSMFRDPAFYRALREVVLPVLRTYPLVRVWHAGCATGEEVYSLAILLHEEGLYGRCRVYATDMSEGALRQAETGGIPLRAMRQNTTNYLQAGGHGVFARYYRVKGNQALLDPELRARVVFAQHNLVTDRSFNEFNLVLCRNVLIYFNRRLQERVHRLLYQSLGRLGFLGLGARETVQFTPHESHYRQVAQRIYRKVA
jgi:chemotaxis protein methyltransferase CheR